MQSIWRDDHTKTFTFKGDITSQVHPSHLIKMGLEAQYNTISYIDIQDGGTKLSRYGQGIDSIAPPGPFNLFGQNRWVFDVKPIIASAYIQDKFELEYLVINAGVRIDYFNLGNSVMQQDWVSSWERATGLKANWKQGMFKISPRFGVSFPISENTVVFFSYGHFNQLPELQFFYRDPYSSGFTGNPALDYEQTILYEFGFTHQLTDYWAIDIKNYGKDISKQIGTTRVYSVAGDAHRSVRQQGVRPHARSRVRTGQEPVGLYRRACDVHHPVGERLFLVRVRRLRPVDEQLPVSDP